MFGRSLVRKLVAAGATSAVAFAVALSRAQSSPAQWSFAVSGDSRNCGDFVMPAIAAKVKAENDVFYWHLGDFRWIAEPDQDLIAMEHAGNPFSKEDYHKIAWDDFLARQIASFSPVPVFLGRGNHETVKPMTREGYIEKFATLLDRPEIEAQRKADGANAAPIGPWYHWTRDGVDFITLDNASHDEFSDVQLRWLRGVLDRDLAPNSGIRTIVAGMHEALPHSTGSEHAMDDWDLGQRSGELVYTWFYDAQAAGKHVYLIASHSHYYSPNIFDTPYWKQHSDMVVPGWIMGAAGARRYKLPRDADKAAKTHIYGYMQGSVHADGSIDFTLNELSENDLIQSRWPNAPLDAIHECYVHNADESLIERLLPAFAARTY
jgi:Calcineurin-like phosphoesterase